MSSLDGVPRPWLVAHLVLLVTGAAFLVFLNRAQWFFGDEWEFFVNRGFVGARLGLFYPHNEHWSTLPIIVSALLRDTVGLASYWPYIGVLIAVHLTLTHLLWRVMLRAAAAPAVATVAAAVFSVLGAGYENLLWAFQIGFVGSVMFGWAGVLVAATPDRRPVRRDAWAVLLLIASLMCSGIGVPMVVVAAVAVLISSRALWRPLLVGGVPALVFLVWYETIGHIPPTANDKPRSLGSVVSIISKGLGRMAMSATGASRLVAAALLVVLGAWCVWAVVRVVRRRPDGQSTALALGGVVGVAVFAVMVALGRGSMAAPRYAYVSVAMSLPAIALALTALCRWRWVQVVAVLALAAVGVHNVQLLRAGSEGEAAREAWTRDVIVSSARLVSDGSLLVGKLPEPVYDPDIKVASLRTLVERNGLPTTGGTPRGDLAARLALQVAVVTTDGLPASTTPAEVTAATPAEVTAGEGAMASSGTRGCFVARPGAPSSRVTVHPTGEMQSLWLHAGTSASRFELALGTGESAPPPRTVVVKKGTEQELVTTLPAGSPDLTVQLMTVGTAVCTAS